MLASIWFLQMCFLICVHFLAFNLIIPFALWAGAGTWLSVRPESKLHKKEYVNAPKWGCSNMRVLDNRDVQKHSCSKTRMLRKHKRPKTRMLKNAKPFRAGMGAVLRLCEGGDSPPPLSDTKSFLINYHDQRQDAKPRFCVSARGGIVPPPFLTQILS